RRGDSLTSSLLPGRGRSVGWSLSHADAGKKGLAMQFKSRRCVVEQLFPLSPSQIWALLSDTDHLNRIIGLPSVTYQTPVIEPNAFYREACTKFLGLIPVRWKEYPFEWVQPERYSVLRLFEGGPLQRFVGVIELLPASSGTLVRITSEMTPRN